MNSFRLHLLYFIFFLSGIVCAQTINEGEIYVLEDTDFSTEQAFLNNNNASFINDGKTYFYNDLVNNGSIDYSTITEGLTLFSGATAQEISGEQISYFYDVNFNNSTIGPNAIILKNSITIANNAEFNDGIVKTETTAATIIFENEAIASNASNDSFVDGVVLKEGDTDFDFPVGDSGFLRPTLMSAPEAPSAIFTAEYIFENPNQTYPLENKGPNIELVNDSEYWIVENSSGAEEVFITLSWNDAVTPAAILSGAPDAIHVVRWSEANEIWEDLGGVVDVVNTRVTTFAAIEEYGVFTLALTTSNDSAVDDYLIYNVITPNSDGVHDYFTIKGIENLANNKVQIYNRWGAKVFSTTRYDTTGNVFRGNSDKGLLITDKSDLLPSGTYFYILTFDRFELDGTSEEVRKVGYLFLQSD